VLKSLNQDFTFPSLEYQITCSAHQPSARLPACTARVCYHPLVPLSVSASAGFQGRLVPWAAVITATNKAPVHLTQTCAPVRQAPMGLYIQAMLANTPTVLEILTGTSVQVKANAS
jgi:hypothetical protein